MNNRKSETRTEMKGFDIDIEVSDISAWLRVGVRETAVRPEQLCSPGTSSARSQHGF
jgi:hypothetical protein